MTHEAARSLMLMSDGLPPQAAGEFVDSLSLLVARAQAGDTEAFEQIMVCAQHRVAATAWRFLGNREDARDAAQEVFLRAYKYLRGFKAGQDFNGWLYRITVNVCRDMLRARRSTPSADAHSATHAGGKEPFQLETLASRDDTEEGTLLAQRRSIVSRALATLPEKERTAIVLRDLEGHTTEEVARLMNTRPATVRSQVSTARTKIKTFYERLLRERPGGTRL